MGRGWGREGGGEAGRGAREEERERLTASRHSERKVIMTHPKDTIFFREGVGRGFNPLHPAAAGSAAVSGEFKLRMYAMSARM